MTTKQYKIAKYLYHKEKSYKKIFSKFKIDLHTFNQIFFDCYNYLDLIVNHDEYDKTVVSLSIYGEEEFEKLKNKSMRFWLPLIISVIALIKSFDNEIIYIMMLLVQLLKQ